MAAFIEHVCDHCAIARLGPDACGYGDPFVKMAVLVRSGDTATVKAFVTDPTTGLPHGFTGDDFRDLERLIADMGHDFAAWERADGRTTTHRIRLDIEACSRRAAGEAQT